jgi:hypothetical protein
VILALSPALRENNISQINLEQISLRAQVVKDKTSTHARKGLSLPLFFSE